MVAAVTQDFLRGGYWDLPFAYRTYAGKVYSTFNNNTLQPYVEILSGMQNRSSNLTKLTNSECQSAFGTPKVQSPYLNVLVTTNYTSNNSFIDGLLYYPK